MSDTQIFLSCRNELGDEVERLGPFLNVIFRPGSNWIETQLSPTEWETISGAHYIRVLVVVDTGEPIAPRERITIENGEKRDVNDDLDYLCPECSTATLDVYHQA